MVGRVTFVMNYCLFISLLSIALIFYNCKNDSLCPPPSTCQGLEEYVAPARQIPDSTILRCDTCLFPCYEISDSDFPYDYTYPSFNPNDPDQLAYYRHDNLALAPGSEVWIMDFCTGGQQLITDNAFYGLDWGANGWLAYTGTDQNIWKVKSNGDSLAQLTFIGDYNRFPKWNPNGERIAFQSEIMGATFFFISDEHGKLTDTLEELSYAGAWSWIGNDRICYMVADMGMPYTGNLNYYDLSSGEVHFLHQIYYGDTSSHLLVVNTSFLQSENKIVWCGLGAVGLTDLSTGSYQIIHRGIIQEWFEHLTVRPGTGQLLINKGSRYYVDPCLYDSELGFYLIDSDGKNPRKVDLPE